MMLYSICYLDEVHSKEEEIDRENALTVEFIRQITILRIGNQQIIDELKNEYLQSIENLKNEHRSQLNELRNEYQRSIDDFKKEHQQHIDHLEKQKLIFQTKISKILSYLYEKKDSSFIDKIFEFKTDDFALKEMIISASVDNIYASFFTGCSLLTQITIPASVIKIENRAFEGCISLTKIEIPSSVQNIGEYSFKGC